MTALEVVDKHIESHTVKHLRATTDIESWLQEYAVKVLQTVRVEIELEQVRASQKLLTNF